MTSVYDFSAKNIKGEDVALADFSGKALLIVNTASKCGFTPQYKGLQKVYAELQGEGLEILGFPCNQFGKQEQGNETQIAEFCDMNFGVEFPMFSKIEVNGDGAHPLYQHLKNEAPGSLGIKAIKWNFTKFLVNKEGQVVKRYAPTTKPEDIVEDIKKVL
ncbi:MAG: glutathione peroxidase [Gammaproteobacteria bacterium]|nr:glutathione peroxidase [Gammaproteobacteria bacterium]